MNSGNSNGFKRWSYTYTQQLVLGLILALAVLVMTLYLISAGLRCVDRDGCLREHCMGHFDRFNEQYKTLIRESMSGNAKCRLQLGSQ
jgi:hypothetical protein